METTAIATRAQVNATYEEGFNPHTFFSHPYKRYTLPTPLTVEAIDELLKDEPEVINCLRAYGQGTLEYEQLIKHASIFDIILGVKKETLKERQERRVAAIRTALPISFQNSLPEQVHGYTADEVGYWFEPERLPLRSDSPLFYYTIPANDYSMAPRFLPGVTIVVEQMQEGDPIVAGEFYCTGCGWYFGRARRVKEFMFNSSEGREIVKRLEFTFDADPRPQDCPDEYSERCESLNFLRKRGLGLYRFVRYHDLIEPQVAPDTVVKRRDWAKIKQRFAKCEAQRLAKNAQQRAAYARRKQPTTSQQQRQEKPAFAVVWPTRSAHRATA